MKSLKALLLTVGILLTGISLKAQVEISGQVKDFKTNDNLEFCTVAVYNAKDSLITGVATDNKGLFTATVKKGVYYAVISYIGYKNDTIKTQYMSENKFLGVFKLITDDKMLKEISVKANTTENQIDRQVVIVTKKLKVGTSNTKDLLDKLNGITFDRYNNSIKVDGDDNVVFLVNGLKKDQEYIKNLSPDRIKKVEVIRDPSGRYGLEGYAAVINIILKMNYTGTEVYFSSMSLIDSDASKPANIFAFNYLNSTVNYTKNRINLYGKFSNNMGNFHLPTYVKKTYEDGTIIEKNLADDYDSETLVSKRFSNNYTGGLDFYINPKHTVSVEGNISDFPRTNNNTFSSYDVYNSTNGVLDKLYSSESANNSSSKSAYGSFFYKGILNDKNSLNVEFIYSNSSDTLNNEYTEIERLHRIETGNNFNKKTKFYAELTHNLSEKTNVQIGYGNTYSKLNNSMNYNTENLINDQVSENSNDIEYTETRHKLYLYFSWKVNRMLGVKLGGAIETSTPKSEGMKHTFIQYQPYVDIKIKPHKYLDIKLKYRSRTQYPSISKLNPFETVIDNETVRKGNIDLAPEVTHKLSVKMLVMGGLLSVEPYYHFSNNYISSVGTLRSDGIFEYSYDNTGKYTHKGIKGNLTLPLVGRSLILQSGVNYYNSNIEYKGENFGFNDWRMNSQLIYINQKYNLVAGIIYQKNLSNNITTQGYNRWNNDFWMIMAQKDFFKKRLNVMVGYFPPVEFGIDYDQGSYIKTESYEELNVQNIKLLKNMFMVKISFRFNKGKVTKKRDKDLKEEYERKGGGLF